ncbi:MAG: SIMPL domain-containing protein, partial [Nitrospirota bacterium]
MIDFSRRRFPWFVMAFVTCALWPVACWSDENYSSPPTLTVSAEGKVRVPPDKALVRLAVETAGESLETVQELNRKKMRQILNRLQELGIEEKHMQTSS